MEHFGTRRGRFGRTQADPPTQFPRRPPTPYGRFRQGLNAACRRYLAFAPQYRCHEKSIAWEAVRWATDSQNDRVGHNQNLSLDEMAVFAVRAHLRHQYTGYDQSRRTASKLSDQQGILYPSIRSAAERQVDEFINRHRNPDRSRC